MSIALLLTIFNIIDTITFKIIPFHLHSNVKKHGRINVYLKFHESLHRVKSKHLAKNRTVVQKLNKHFCQKSDLEEKQNFKFLQNEVHTLGLHSDVRSWVQSWKERQSSC